MTRHALSGSGTSGETWEWNGTDWTQRFPVVSPPPLRRHVMAFDTARGHVVLYGGENGQGLNQTVWEWDGTTWQQLAVMPGPTDALDPAAAYDPTLQTLVVHGGLPSRTTLQPLGETWLLGTPGRRARPSSASVAAPHSRWR